MMFLMLCQLSVICSSFSILQHVDALKCFECTLSDAGCGDPIRSQQIKAIDCQNSVFTISGKTMRHANEDIYRCLTTIEKNSSNTLYTRRCALKEENIICDPRSQSGHQSMILKECILCKEDFCNSSTRQSYYFGHYLLLAIIVTLQK